MFRNIKATPWFFSLAAITLIFSSWQAYSALLVIYPQIGSGNASQFSPVQVNHSFLITSTSPETPDCLGYLEGGFDRNLERGTYSLKGEVFLSLGDKILPTKIDLETSFNVLGQLSAAILKIGNMDSNFTLGTLGVNPIEITFFSSSLGTNSRRQQLSIPGPILLKDQGDHFFLDYPSSGKNLPLKIENYPIETLLEVKMNRNTNARSTCLEGPKSSLELLSTVTKLRTRLAKLLPLLPSGLALPIS